MIVVVIRREFFLEVMEKETKRERERGGGHAADDIDVAPIGDEETEGKQRSVLPRYARLGTRVSASRWSRPFVRRIDDRHELDRIAVTPLELCDGGQKGGRRKKEKEERDEEKEEKEEEVEETKKEEIEGMTRVCRRN